MKNRIKNLNCLYPMPVILVGAMVNGKPNYITIAHVGIMTYHVISLGMGKEHFTNAGIKENRTFSLNIPSEEMVKETDYCGIVSGKNVDKAALFDNFYGELDTAPMIAQCPINMECRVVQIIDFPVADVFLGEIVNSYCDDEFLTEGKVDYVKDKPILFDMRSKSYWKLGSRLAKAWKIGKALEGS